MDWKKYQIDAVVDTINKRLNELTEQTKAQLRASYAPTTNQQEILDLFDELSDAAEKVQKYADRYDELKEKLNDLTRKEAGCTFTQSSYYRCPTPDNVQASKEFFIENIISRKLPKLPDYRDIYNELTVATISAAFDIEAWIEKFIEKVGFDKCAE